MSAKIVSQRKWAKLVASTNSLSQPPGAVTRLSNLLFTQRGGLQICSGSFPIGFLPASYPLPLSVAVFSNNLTRQYPYYSALSQRSSPLFANVTGFTAAPSGATTNPAGTYLFAIVAIGSSAGTDHTGITTLGPFAEFTTASTFASVIFNWTAVVGAYGYQIWMINANPLFGTNLLGSLIATVTPGTTATYTFTGTLPLPAALTTPAPFANTTQYLNLFVLYQVPNHPITDLLTVGVTGGSYPALPPQAASLLPGDPAFVPLTPAPGFSPYGGLAGVACPIPQQLTFAGLEILILGNGLPPQSYDPSLLGATPPAALTNTFTAAYPTWQPSVSWLTGSQVTDGAGNYYTATQGGVSQTPGPPTWATAKGAETADGSVIWTSQGPIITPPAPRAAAHAVAYAGSLWLANTSPTTTTDQIDGPTCLKMSDSNNPNSWNPVNTAFIGRDDGTQITGLQPFTIAALGISPTGSLCVFKEFLTFQVIGVFGSSSFEIQPAQTNLGCLAARSIQFLPGFGVVRYSHLGFAVFDGINDRLISEDIRPYLFGGVDSESDLTPVDPAFLYLSQSAQTASPPMYLCAMPLAASPAGGLGSGMLTRLFCYDLVMKAWAILDLPWPITSLSAATGGEGYPLVLAGKTDGTLQRLQSGDLAWNENPSTGVGTAVAWSFRSPDVFGEGSSQKIFYQEAIIRGYGSAAMVQSILAQLWLDGKNLGMLQPIDIVPQAGTTLFEVRVSIFRSGYRAHLDVSGNNGGASGVIDAIDWVVTPKNSQARRVIG
jgi:hypothetical protein